MQGPKCILALLALFGIAGVTFAQSTVPITTGSTAKGATFLQQSVMAVAAGGPINDITLTGNVTVYPVPGATTGASTTSPSGTTSPQSGSISLIGVGDSQSQIVLTLSSGKITQTRGLTSAGIPTETYTAADGTVYHPSPDNLLTPHAAWFLPSSFMPIEAASDLLASDNGSQVWNSATVEHLSVLQRPYTIFEGVPLLPQTSRRELYLDPATSLPVDIIFNVREHPQDFHMRPIEHAVVTIPEEIRFSNYQFVQAHPIPNHIQVLINGNLWYDITISTATVNSGATIPNPS